MKITNLVINWNENNCITYDKMGKRNCIWISIIFLTIRHFLHIMKKRRWIKEIEWEKVIKQLMKKTALWGYLSLPDRTSQNVNDPKVGSKWGLGEGKIQARAEARAQLFYAGHRPTVQWGPDDPSWSWTQIWAQARMPDYSI